MASAARHRELVERLSEVVKEMLEGLPAGYWEALYLTEYEGLTQKELAERLGISMSGAKSRVQRTRARLRALPLDCCHFELDVCGRVMDFEPPRECCSVSGPGARRATT